MLRESATAELLESTAPTMDDVYLTPAEVAQRLRCGEQTLANLRARGEGIPYCKPTGGVLYTIADVLAIESGRRRGFTWAKLAEALDTFDDLKPKQRARLLEHLKREMTK